MLRWWLVCSYQCRFLRRRLWLQVLSACCAALNLDFQLLLMMLQWLHSTSRCM